MNKPALKRFATEARRELLERVELQARKIGITSDGVQKATIESSDAIFINGRQLKEKEKAQRNKLISRIRDIGFDRVIDEVAYTWFNRFTALRFMEVNDYLPTRVRVLSSINKESVEPDMIREALSLDLDIDKEYVYELKLNNNNEKLFKYLIIKHCNDLSRYMPFMFETIDDYTEILFPEGLLSADSFISKMTHVEVIPESNWQKIEIIGWLYQYYIVEEKDQVFANLKKNIKITKDALPAATQLFTPNWIVRYLVENSLGRIWLESNPSSPLKTNWMYYLDEVEQDSRVINQLEEIKYQNVNPEEITFLDPSCGSGHILVYAFDLFYDLYLEKGYMENEIPELILEKNLFGLEIDNRAAQLASFAITMKAREKSRRIFRHPIKLNICAIEDSNWLTEEIITNIASSNVEVIEILRSIKSAFLDAKEYGSLLEVITTNTTLLMEYFQKYVDSDVDLVGLLDKEIVEEKLPLLIKQAVIMSRKFDVVCTNPPYMGRSGMNKKLSGFLDKNFPNSKSDLFASFIEKGFSLSKTAGFNSMVTMQSWMFLSSYEKMRKNIVDQKVISSLLHMDNMVMGIAFGTAATVFRNISLKQYKGSYTEVKFKDIQLDEVPYQFPVRANRYNNVSAINFSKIPGSPIAYWVSDKFTENFAENKLISDYGKPGKGIDTGNNDLFLRFWFEVNNKEIGINFNTYEDAISSNEKYYPYNKGGSFRKWYGNNEYVIYWENDGEAIKNYPKSNLRNKSYYRKDGLTWSTVTSGSFSIREFGYGFYFDNGGSCLFIDNKKYFMGLLNSKVFLDIQKISPTLNFQPGDIGKVPVIINDSTMQVVESIVSENVELSKKDWNSFENSWDFKKHPLLNSFSKSITSSFTEWENITSLRFDKLKSNEEKLNKIFIELYGLEGELTPEIEDKTVTIRKANLEDDIKSLISYIIGCIFGRYSLDKDGLIYAGGSFNHQEYNRFAVDRDNIIPITESIYFDDDIVNRIVEFIRITFKEETLEENLNLIAMAIGIKNSETSREAIRRYLVNDFYKNHIQLYKKRPIYWLFTSGKEKAFNCLIYMHRYDKTTLSRIRTDYLHEVQIRMDSEKKDLLNIIVEGSSTKEISNAKKELNSLDKKIDELKAYDELLHHMADQQIEIDLDDGVAVNYAKFEGLVAKI